jgi:LmbE family N-acetylglucosaminyl deacetylase
MALTVLSPHLDDAVLSCWHVLREDAPVKVLNVFAGVPPDGTPRGWWDRLTGAPDSCTRVRERLAEDRAALALAGRVPVNLDLLDEQHRGCAVRTDELAQRIGASLCPGDVLYAPAALGVHPDHVYVRAAALYLRAAGVRVRLYADLPHAITRGWPTWVAPDGVPEADAAWAWAAPGETPRVHVIQPAEQACKRAAITAYATQVAAVEMGLAPIERTLSYEVVWELS